MIPGTNSRPQEVTGQPGRPASHLLSFPSRSALQTRLWAIMVRPDVIVGLLLFLAGFYAYHYTLAPTVLDGDAALFQYTPYVLGVTYPTGYPFYLLLGKLWLTLFPIGEVAWRMNLLSALCSAVALPLIYGAACRLLAPAPEAARSWPLRGGALLATLIFATLPTLWRWSTEAKIYALNILLFSGTLYTLGRAWELERRQKRQTSLGGGVAPPTIGSDTPPPSLLKYPLALPLLLLGLQISVHSTTVLLLPGLLLFIWLQARPRLPAKKSLLVYAACLFLPGLLYFYIPLRAEGLIARYGRLEAIHQGLLADFYHSGWAGWLRYFTAADFTGGVVTNWGQVPRQLFTVYLPLLLEDFTLIGASLGLIGGLGLLLHHPRRFLPLFLLYALPIPFVLTYGQGEQSAFLLPSYLSFSLFAGYTPVLTSLLLNKLFLQKAPALPLLTNHESRITNHALHVTPHILPFTLYVLLFIFFLLPQIQENLNWLTRKWGREIHEEWADALNHPLAPGAGMLAHWGDLTSFWYMQHVEGRRPDLRGVYPPDEARLEEWYAQGYSDLYIAGPLQGWVAGIEERYRLIPWGRLVRIAPKTVEPQTLLPALPHRVEALFDHKLRLISLDYPALAIPDQVYPVTLTWQALAELPPETTLSLRLVQGETIVTQVDDTLRSGWFPTETLPAGQYILSYAPLPVPLGLLPGQYRLQLVAYTKATRPWSLADGAVVLDLGPVEVGSPPADYEPDLTGYRLPAQHDFNGEIRLAGYTYSVSRVGQGKGFALSLLWQALAQPADNYTLLAEIVDAQGQVLRAKQVQPLSGQAPTAGWQPGQFTGDQLDLVVPAGAPSGEAAISVQLSWLRPDGSRLNLRRWSLPMGSSLNLETLTVMAKEDRNFESPALRYHLDLNLENKVRLLGYNLPAPAGTTGSLHFDQADCAARRPACTLKLTFYWQALAEMELPYQVFLHIVNEKGTLVAQQDRTPGPSGKQPTTGWLPGEVIDHPVELPLPADIAPGRYQLRLGLYFPPTGPRLFILDGQGQPGSDFVEVTTLEVEAR